MLLISLSERCSVYQLLSPKIIVENIIVLASPYITTQSKLDSVVLKQAYCDYLQNIQPYCPLIRNDQLFYADAETEFLFQNYFSDPEIDMTEVYQHIDINKVMYPDPNTRCDVLNRAFSRMEQQDSTFGSLFRLVMNTIFCTVSKHIGGTSVNPKYLGVMCAHHDMHSEETVVPELLIHEFTHHTVLLDEHRYGHYKSYQALSDPDTHIDSYDRGMHFKFPLNRIMHSMLVAVEVIKLRDNYIGHLPCINQHANTEVLIARDKEYIKTIEKNRRIQMLFTERGYYLYETVKAFYNNDA